MSDEEKVTPEKEAAETAESEKSAEPETESISAPAEGEADRNRKKRIITAFIAAGVLTAVIISAVVLILSPKKNEDPSPAENAFVTSSAQEESRAPDIITSEISAGGLPVGGDPVRTEESKPAEVVSSEESSARPPVSEDTVRAE